MAERDKPAANLWIGTALFALIAAGLLALSIRMGRRAIVGSSDKKIEMHAIEAK